MKKCNVKWNKKLIQKSALKYKFRSDWFYGDPKAYVAAGRYGGINLYCDHMKSKYGVWTDELIQESALRYQFRTDWQKGDISAYIAAKKRQGGVGKFCRHMESKYIKWTDELIQASALKYQFRVDWQNGDINAYGAARRSGNIGKFCHHMTLKYMDWTDDDLQASALKYDSRGAWQYNDRNAYIVARRRYNGDVTRFCHHMRKCNMIWTNELIHESALKYSTASEWRKAEPNAYAAGLRNVNIENFCQHMTIKPKIKTVIEAKPLTIWGITV